MAILRRIFQPKWQSRNPDTRLEAVGNLLWEQEEQRTILLKLAETDPDTRVSQRAIEKIAEPDALLKLLARDRKSTRLNSSHVRISYAVFCLKKKNNRQ